MRIYAVGDIHGRADLLAAMADLIAHDLATLEQRAALTIFLGDYIDRGPSSAAVVERLSQSDFPTPIECLRGNHEDVLLHFLDTAATLDAWRRFGGLETLHAYRVPIAEAMRGAGYEQARAALLAAMPARHAAFLRSLRTHVEHGGYYFCHAGVRPGVALPRQSPADLLWIRDEFLSFPGDFGKVVVHGHTPAERAELLDNRINVDTGAYASGVLTAVVLQGDERRVLSARAS